MGGDTGNSLLDTIVNSEENIIDVFNENIVAIFAHPKEDIVNCCTNVDNDKLTAIRADLFQQLKTAIPGSQYSEGFELFKRKLSKKLAEDIYVLGCSVVNKQEDSGLKKVLKAQSGTDVTITDLNETLSENVNLVETCASMKTSMEAMAKQIRGLITRVESLESEVTVLRMNAILDSKSNKTTNPSPVEKDKIVPDTMSVIECLRLDTDSESDMDSTPTVHKIKAQVHNDANGVPQFSENKITGF